MIKPLTKASREFLLRLFSIFVKWAFVALRRDWQRNPILFGLTPTFSPVVLAPVLTWQDKLPILTNKVYSFAYSGYSIRGARSSNDVATFDGP